MTRRTETGVMMMATERVLVGTQPAASLHWRSTAEDATETTVTYAMSSATEMHVVVLKTGAEIGSMKSKNNTMKGTMITMVLTMTILTRSGHQERDIFQEASRRTLET
jgi:archaellum biogenesis protein FlaJ (TadC family)